MLELVGEQLVMAAEVDERGALVGKLEPDFLDLAGVFAAAVHVGFDGHLLERRGLVAGQIREIKHRIAVRPDAHVVLHVGGLTITARVLASPCAFRWIVLFWLSDM